MTAWRTGTASRDPKPGEAAASGFTTGACAAAAAKAALLALVDRPCLPTVDIRLPDGDGLCISVLYARKRGDTAEAAVIKHAGDDPDVTDGAQVVASVSWTQGDGIEFRAGDGIGMVTKKGLSIAPGEPAINPVPRRMISEALREVAPRGIRVVLSIPGGRDLAARTFNPRLGIEGGLSILGTSGRVRPFSCPALRTSLVCCLDVAAAGGTRAPVLVPGRIGARAARLNFQLSEDQVVEIGNEWGFMIDETAGRGFEGVMVLGHPGKLAKLVERNWDTHSSRSRSAVPLVSQMAEVLTGRRVAPAPTVEGVFLSLSAKERRHLGDRLAELIRAALRERAGGRLAVAVVLVDMKGEILGWEGDSPLWKR